MSNSVTLFEFFPISGLKSEVTDKTWSTLAIQTQIEWGGDAVEIGVG